MSESKDREKVAQSLVELAASPEKMAAMIVSNSLPAVLVMVASLVTRPSCRMREFSASRRGETWGMTCSSCGARFEYESHKSGWRYCPKCGAVVEGDADE